MTKGDKHINLYKKIKSCRHTLFDITNMYFKQYLEKVVKDRLG